jgi:hypothetical protein
MSVEGLRARAIEANDAHLDGSLSRAEWAVEIAAIDADLAAAGLTWDDLDA